MPPLFFNYAWDANGDGQIDLEDYSVLSGNWQPSICAKLDFSRQI